MLGRGNLTELCWFDELKLGIVCFTTGLMLGNGRTFVGCARAMIGLALGDLFGVDGGFGIISFCFGGMLGSGRLTVGRTRVTFGFDDEGGLGIRGSRVVWIFDKTGFMLGA